MRWTPNPQKKSSPLPLFARSSGRRTGWPRKQSERIRTNVHDPISDPKLLFAAIQALRDLVSPQVRSNAASGPLDKDDAPHGKTSNMKMRSAMARVVSDQAPEHHN